MTRSQLIDTARKTPRALIISVQTPSQDDADVEHSLAELRQLLGGLGIPIAAEVLQKRAEALDTHVLGRGKLSEVQQLLEQVPAEEAEDEDEQAPWLVVFDGDLSPSQQRSLSQSLNTEVVDRTQVILTVFRERARTRVAQLEIELAQLEYETPRVRDNQSLLARQAGGGGRGGRGHTVAELKKQQLRRRVGAVRDELGQAKRAQLRRRERREQVASAALVGYTNAGKSSWMRALTKSEVMVQDKLFATLDTTVRVLAGVSPRVVLADTVGFLRNLPNHLLASFRSTLDEALDADLLLLVVDASDPNWQAQMQVTQEVLAEVDADETPQLVLLNKCDRVPPEALSRLTETLPEALLVSSRDAADVARVRDAIAARIDAQRQQCSLHVPFAQGALLSQIHQGARVLSERFDATGALLELRANASDIAGWKKQLGSS